MKKKEISRRHLLKGLMAAAGGLGLHQLAKRLDFEAMAQTLDNFVYLPIIFKGESEPLPPPATNGRVVHVHDPDATSWDFSTGWYGDYVNQTAVTAMVERGLMELTGTNSVQAAWAQLLPNYQSGQAIAIKVNFNNARCDDSDNQIDGLIEPVNAVVSTLKTFGVAESNIWVYDALRPLPDRFVSRCLHNGVRFFDSASKGCREDATFNSDDPNAQVNFQHANLSNRRLTDVVINADYLINMPIMKDHGIHPVTLGFKNHFGSINKITGPGDDDLHLYINPMESVYNPNYSPLVDIYLNPHIGGKTVLTVGDGLYGALGGTRAMPDTWQSFSDKAPNSLFFSTDPVAIDCVMLDILYAEPVYHDPNQDQADDYLKVAASAGLGTHDRNYPWTDGGYSNIEYIRVEL